MNRAKIEDVLLAMGVPAGNPSDIAYNATKIAQTHIHDTAPIYLAQAIAEHWKSIKEREDN